MTEESKRLATKLSELNDQIGFELSAFSDNVSAITETPDKATYSRYCRHLDFIQDLIEQANSVDRQVIPDRNDPSFYSTLKEKELLHNNEASFRLFRGSFLRKYQQVEEQDQDLVLSIERDEPRPNIEDLEAQQVQTPSSDVLSEEDLELAEQEAFLEEAWLEAEAKAEKAREKAEKQKKQRKDAEKRAAADRQRQEQIRQNEESLRRQQTEAQILQKRQEEAQRLGMYYTEGKMFTESELAAERARQYDADLIEKSRSFERSEEAFANLSALRERERASAESTPLEKGHIDFSRDIYGNQEESPREATPYQSQSSEDVFFSKETQSAKEQHKSNSTEQGQRDPYEHTLSHANYQPAESVMQQEGQQVFYASTVPEQKHTRYPERQDIQKENVSDAPHFDTNTVSDSERYASESFRHSSQPSETSVQSSYPERPADIQYENAETPITKGEPHNPAFTGWRFGSETPYREFDETSGQNTFMRQTEYEREEAPYAKKESYPEGVQMQASEVRTETQHTKPSEDVSHARPFSQPQTPEYSERYPYERKASAASYETPDHALGSQPTVSAPYVYDVIEQVSTSNAQTAPVQPIRTSSVSEHDVNRHSEPQIENKDANTLTHRPKESHRAEQGIPVSSEHIGQASEALSHPSSSGHAAEISNQSVKTTQAPVTYEDKSLAKHTVLDPEHIAFSHNTHQSQKTDAHPVSATKTPEQETITHTRPSETVHRTQKSQSISQNTEQSTPIQKHYSYTPDGVKEETQFNFRQRPSGDNNAIYSAIQKTIGDSKDGTAVISSAYVSQMKWNTAMARVEYRSKQGTAEALAAAKDYQTQRAALQSLNRDIRSGRIKVEDPKESAQHVVFGNRTEQQPVSPYQRQYNYVPDGVVGVTLDKKGQVTSNFFRKRREERESFRYTSENPMKVTPAYEAAMLRRLSNANAAMDTAVKMQGSAPSKLNAKAVQELRLSQEAYEGFRRAKQAGTVVVSEDGTFSRPNFQAWQQRKRTNVFGTTFTPKTISGNRVKKESVEEISASLLKRGSSKLKEKPKNSALFEMLGSRIKRFQLASGRLASRSMYSLLQSGDDNSVHTFEQGRYYLSAGYGITRAARHGNLIVTQKKINAAHAAMEMQRKAGEDALTKKFGKLNKNTNLSLSKEIKDLQTRAKAIKEQINVLAAKGSALSSQERSLLKALMKEKKDIGSDIGKMIGLKHSRKALELRNLKMKSKLNMLSKDANAVFNGLYSLQHFILRPLRESAETGTQGVGAAIRIASNRNLHILLRKAFRFAGKVVPHTAAFLLTGDLHTAQELVRHGQMVKNAVKTGIKTQVAVTKQATKNAAKAAGQAAKQATKKTISAITPKPVKQGVHYLASNVRSKYTIAVGIKNKVFQKFWASKMGRSISAVSRFTHRAADAIRLGASVLKSIGIKALAGFLGVILLIMFVSSGISLVSGSIGGIIMSPDTDDDGRIKLSSYYNILLDEWNLYMDDLKARGENGGYYKTTVNMDGKPGNVREIISMMAVRMCQDLDLYTNYELEAYLRSLLRDMNPISETKGTCYCKGKDCKERVVFAPCDCILVCIKPHPTSVCTCELKCTKDHSYKEKYCDKSHKTLTISVDSLHFGPQDLVPDPVFNVDTMGNAGATTVTGDMIGLFTITYYCAEKYEHICNAGPPYKTAIGTTPTVGRTIAVDKNKIPLRSKVVIDGHTYTAEDTGGAVDGNHIDILVKTHEEALRKGTRKNVPVYAVGYEGEGIQSSDEWNGWTDDNQIWAKNICNGGVDWSELYYGIPNVTDVVGIETSLDGVQFIDGDRPGNQAIVNIALGQVGNVSGQPYWSWYGFPSRVEWCATFVSWCANQNGVLDTAVPKFASCSLEGVPWFKKKQQWAKRGDITPVAGDIIFFDWQWDGKPDHVGIVVGTDGKNVYTVEGNSRDQVRTKAYRLSDKQILGYGLPNY